ncbi:hypothetical protein SAMN05428995_10657 [Loktanella sp. DSM 29012]|uniref:hypothetical protein n=1 Tax=Loktanella sp. DSM 29012 TaxID=1881056 RepID=UPI0008CD2B48|nr:hypothetical protein [Loktanella sp. DSM 29012]SEQ68682.1 hypothetical protein SAMN05428995_10657 [Loktanella sp. DSM 29012]
MSSKTNPATEGKTVTLKPATPKVDTTPAKAQVAAPAPKVVGTATALDAGEPIKKPEFIDRAVARSGVKKKDAKPAIEAAMAELADILLAGGELILPPMGKLKSIKSKDLGEGAQMLTLKLRTMKDGAGQGAGPNTSKTGVADDDEDG